MTDSDDRADDPSDDRSDDRSDDHSDDRAEPKKRSGGPVPVRESVKGGDDSQRPTPVRQAMEAERETRQPIETPSVRFQRDGEEWIARTEGRTTAGFRGDAGAPLLFLTFARASEPETRLRETVAVGRSLLDLSPGQLGMHLADARPYDGEWEGSELFPGTRKSRQSRH